jgi:hypothetical protein
MGAMSNHLPGRDGYSLQDTLELMDNFGLRHNCLGYITWAKEPMAPYLVSPKPQKVN